MKALTVVGRLGRDAELRHTQSGEAVLNLNVAVEDRKKVGGEWKTETMWIGVTLFGKRGEGLAKHALKGTRIAASGELNMRTYEGRDGVAKTQIECIARDVEILFDKRSDGVHAAPRAQAQAPSGGDAFDHGDDDIPF